MSKFHRPGQYIVILYQTDFDNNCEDDNDPESTKIVTVFWMGLCSQSAREYVDFWLEFHPVKFYGSWYGDIYPKFTAVPMWAIDASPE